MTNYNIKCNCGDPFGSSIGEYIKKEFPILVQPRDESLLNLLTDAIIATGNVRLGSKPSPESQVAIRQIISHWTEKNLPIPFLVAWGSEKPDGSGVDIGELFALKTLSCLNTRVSTYYSPGVQFRVRVEDASAPHLFYERMDAARRDALLYTKGLVNLVQTIGMNSFINMVPESTLVEEKMFNMAADSVLPMMEDHVNDPGNVKHQDSVRELGWMPNEEMIAFLLGRYARNYPTNTDEENKYTIARYFSGALARRILGITGALKSWEGKFLELSFAGPTPGIDKNRALKRIYYRTMPSSITSAHIPAWRAKGFLKIGDEVCAGLTSFHNTEFQYNPNSITLSSENSSQSVQADYVVLDE